MTALPRWLLIVAIALALSDAPAFAAAVPEGTMTWGVHATLAPAWFDPAETTGISTPFMIIYALHDGLVNPSAWQRLPASPAPRPGRTL